RSIFGWNTEPSPFSTRMHGTPRMPRSPASASPTGPPPAISTGVVSTAGTFFGASSTRVRSAMVIPRFPSFLPERVVRERPALDAQPVQAREQRLVGHPEQVAALQRLVAVRAPRRHDEDVAALPLEAHAVLGA